MPLLDHFHPPLSDERSWEGFHGEWAGMIVRHLNDDVPPTLPLWLDADEAAPLDLESSYESTCRALRIDV